MNRRVIALVALCTLVSSCSSVRLYPVCFFDSVQPNAISKERHVEQLTAALRRFDESAKATEDGRWIVARTTAISHDELQGIWPSLGCIGTVTSGTQVKRNADCTKFISEQLKSGDYQSFDIKFDDVASSDEAPGRPYVICWRSPPG